MNKNYSNPYRFLPEWYIKDLNKKSYKRSQLYLVLSISIFIFISFNTVKYKKQFDDYKAKNYFSYIPPIAEKDNKAKSFNCDGLLYILSQAGEINYGEVEMKNDELYVTVSFSTIQDLNKYVDNNKDNKYLLLKEVSLTDKKEDSYTFKICFNIKDGGK